MLIIAIMFIMRIVIYEVNYYNYKYYIHYCYYAYYVVVVLYVCSPSKGSRTETAPQDTASDSNEERVSCICKLLRIVLLLSIHALIPASPVSCADFTTDFCVL